MTAFDRRRGVVIVPVELFGPLGSVVRMMAVDTGSTYTVVRPDVMKLLGYRTDTPGTVPITTASGAIRVPRVLTERIDPLDRSRHDFNVLVHPLPPALRFSRLLGLDFVRDGRLIFDFVRGDVSFEKR